MSKTLFRKLFSYDASLATFETSNGTMTLPKIFIPFFIEMLLLNLMGTINTFMLSHYSDDAVAAVGSASQILSMVLTLYTVIGTGASIVINHNLGANNKKTASDAAFCSIFFCGFLSLILGTVLAALADTVLGAMHLEAHVKSYAVSYFRIVIAFSFIQALTSTSLFIGWLSGAGKYEQAYRLNLQNLKLTICMNVFLSLCIYLFSEPLLRLFTSDPVILQMGHTLMLFDILVEIGRGFNHIEENSLRGSGDVVYPMIISIFSCWSMSILFSYLLGIKMGLGLTGCWIAFAMDEFFRGTAYLLRWKSRKWMSKTVS